MKKTSLELVFFLLGFTVVVFLSNAPLSLAAPRKFCSDILSGDWKKTDSGVFVRSNSNSTSNLISYFEQLIERQILKNRGLLRLIDGFKQNKFINPISKEEATVDSVLQIQREAIEEYFENTVLDKEKILAWAQSAQNEKEQARVNREETRVVTEKIYQKMEFNSVHSGSFQMGKAGEKVEVTLTHPFEAMSTPVTQNQWVELMGENPSHFKNGAYTVAIIVNGRPVEMQPNHPVENITWWSAIVFANRLSEKQGLKPAYDLSELEFEKNTRPEDGTYKVFENLISGVKDIRRLKINAPNNDIYQTSGYRLPTLAEQEYLLRAMGSANGIYHFGDDQSELKNYAWFKENSNNATHSVADRKPLVIAGKEFYDLIGNVAEKSHDFKALPLRGGENPSHSSYTTFPDTRMLCSGSWFDTAEDLSSGKYYGEPPNCFSTSVGFRLVRSIK